jgi:hypothetical protein
MNWLSHVFRIVGKAEEHLHLGKIHLLSTNDATVLAIHLHVIIYFPKTT